MLRTASSVAGSLRCKFKILSIAFCTCAFISSSSGQCRLFSDEVGSSSGGCSLFLDKDSSLQPVFKF